MLKHLHTRWHSHRNDGEARESSQMIPNISLANFMKTNEKLFGYYSCTCYWCSFGIRHLLFCCLFNTSMLQGETNGERFYQHLARIKCRETLLPVYTSKSYHFWVTHYSVPRSVKSTTKPLQLILWRPVVYFRCCHDSNRWWIYVFHRAFVSRVHYCRLAWLYFSDSTIFWRM